IPILPSFKVMLLAASNAPPFMVTWLALALTGTGPSDFAAVMRRAPALMVLRPEKLLLGATVQVLPLTVRLPAPNESGPAILPAPLPVRVRLALAAVPL